MGARRFIVWLFSSMVGLVSTLGVLWFFDTTLEKYAIGNALLIFLSTGALAFIWLDYILQTRYLRS